MVAGFPESFIMRHADKNNDLKKASCFLINKALDTRIGTGWDTKRLRDGTLLIKIQIKSSRFYWPQCSP